MRFARIASLLEYTAWIQQKYRELQSKSRYIFRVSEVTQDLSGNYKIKVQVIGKAIFIEYSPLEILNNDLIINGFSGQDIRAITYLACQQKSPKYKITSQEFCSKKNEIKFILQKINSNKTIVKTASEISLDIQLINSLDQENVHKIGYITGYEHSQKLSI